MLDGRDGVEFLNKFPHCQVEESGGQYQSLWCALVRDLNDVGADRFNPKGGRAVAEEIFDVVVRFLSAIGGF